MRIADELKYSEDHEWVRAHDGKAYIGITDYAQHNLGEAVFVELPEIGTRIGKGDVIGVVESVKAASDVYSPISGTVKEINDTLEDDPGAINTDPYENWIAVLEIGDMSELDGLMDANGYKEFCAQQDQ